MPVGDPAGYLPNVQRARQRSYTPRMKQRMKQVKVSVGKIKKRPKGFVKPPMGAVKMPKRSDNAPRAYIRPVKGPMKPKARYVPRKRYTR